MPTFEKADIATTRLMDELIDQYEDHKPLREHRVKIDVIMVYPDVNDDGEPQGDALTVGGYKALGKTKVVSLKDRVMGRGDAEICLDALHWKDASTKEKAALLDHEIHHITVRRDPLTDAVMRDDHNRPKLTLRKHDLHVGWFKVIAERHGIFSQERIQAKQILEESGQYFWPELMGALNAGKVIAAPMGLSASPTPENESTETRKALRKVRKDLAKDGSAVTPATA